jgi:hypothetical protein
VRLHGASPWHLSEGFGLTELCRKLGSISAKNEKKVLNKRF